MLFLFISDHFVTAYSRKEGVFDKEVQFENNEAGQKVFEEYLDRGPRELTVYILADVNEEELHNEVMPKLLGSNKQTMLARRSSRIFRSTPFNLGRFQGVDPNDKKKEKVLFMGLTDPDRISPWLNALKDRRAKMVGFWSLPLLSQEIFKHVSSKGKDALFIMPNSGGLRQIFFRDGKIMVSRLSPFPSRNAEDLLVFIYGEVARMQGYLASLRLASHNSVLDVYTLCCGSLYTLMNSKRESVAKFNSFPVNADTLLKSLGVKEKRNAEKVETFFCHFLLKKRIKNHYAGLEYTRVFRMFLLRYWLRVASLVLLVVGIIMGSSIFLEGYEISTQLPALVYKRGQAQAALETISLQELENTEGGEDMVAAIRTLDLVQEKALDPRSALVPISQILAYHEHIVVNGVDWYAGSPESQSQNSGMGPPGRGRRGRGMPPPQLTPPGLQTIRLRGEVYPFSGDVEEAQYKIDQFIEAMKKLPLAFKVTPISMPMDLSQTVVLDSGTTQTKPHRAHFVLLLKQQTGSSEYE